MIFLRERGGGLARWQRKLSLTCVCLRSGGCRNGNDNQLELKAYMLAYEIGEYDYSENTHPYINNRHSKYSTDIPLCLVDGVEHRSR